MSPGHPVAQMLRHVSYFGPKALPNKADLDQLLLPPSARRAVKAACEHAAEIHATGHHQEAWDAAEEAAAIIVESLDEELRDPHYLDPADPLADVTDPDELAAKVPRF